MCVWYGEFRFVFERFVNEDKILVIIYYSL